jgi:hypothetical protein
MRRKVIDLPSKVMTDNEIAKVFEVLRLESEEARRAATFDLYREKDRQQIQISIVKNTDVQTLTTIAPECPPSMKS